MKGLRILLFPFSLVFWLITFLRNKAYDWGLLPSSGFNIPLISLGNLSVGGSGKTPHAEYLVRLLSGTYQVAILSRGYKRKTNGFRLVERTDTVEDSGDEPLQFKNKFQDITVAVDESRKRGIALLMEKFAGLEVILLDDAFQHRSVRPGLSILLTDYQQPYFEDSLLPAGNLREPVHGAVRADIIVVTKTPKIFSPITRKSFIEKINPSTTQPLYFSYLKFGPEMPLTSVAKLIRKRKFDAILMITGIGNPTPLEAHLKSKCNEFEAMTFSDHHPYNLNDIARIRQKFHSLFHESKAIITTEKDAMRFNRPDLIKELQDLPVFYIPIQVEFHPVDKELFNKQILDYVKKNQRNS